MKTLLALSLVLFCAVSTSADDFSMCDSALSQVGMTFEQIRFDQDEMANWGGDLWRTKYFTMFHKDPLKLPRYGQLNLKRLSDNATNTTALLSWAGARIDCPVHRGLIGDQLEKYTTYPDSIPKPSITTYKNVLQAKEFTLLREMIDFFYSIADDSNHLFVRAIENINERISRQGLFDYFVVEETQEYDRLIEEIAPTVDFSRLFGGAQDVAEAVRRMACSLSQQKDGDNYREGADRCRDCQKRQL
jgi:hypothetical protein